ncbi:GGDEF domain-containing phosphodiesterase [Persephonella sp. KM09-Lau-8]|uniref:GGDEF domain-containing phosphodiesterase n=1 Tax=Persephonella sp. KM09-Lau-8 TaxID=1158345 RepID=UPI0004958F6F|nr:GGDEF domain-containing phosphodiesterase [Persephonella sp. KM09-Lau-8]
MLKALEDCLRVGFDLKDVKIITKNELSSFQDYKRLPLNDKYVLVVKGELPYKKAHYLLETARELFHKLIQAEEAIKKLHLLQEEVDIVIKSSELFFSQGNIENFFMFLKDKKVALIENGKIILNTGIDKFTIETSIRKLKKIKEFTSPFKEGEIYGVEFGAYQLIVQDEKEKLDEFSKKIIKTRLLWLDKLFKERNEYLIDDLTGLYTRKKFFYDLKKNYGKSAIFINLKQFWLINSIYGVEFGDKFLKEFGQLLKKISYSENVYRVYGEKFAVVFDNPEEAIEFRELLLSKVSQGIKLYNEKLSTYFEIKPEVSTVIIFSLNELSVEEVMVTFKGKYTGNRNHSILEIDILPKLQKEKEIIKILEKAISEKKVVPHYQKIQNLQDKNDFYFESLMRIDNGKDLLYPAQFLDISRMHGFYPKLSELLLEKVILDSKKTSKRFSINIEVLDLLREDFLDFVKGLVQEHRIDAGNIIFELTENEDFVKVVEDKKDVFFKLRDMNICFAIDDFGKGYSNFNYLTILPISIVKIDGSLISRITSDRKVLLIVENINSIAHGLGIKTVAEFVSDEEIYKLVKDIGIDYAQGFYISKPESLDNLI